MSADVQNDKSAALRWARSWEPCKVQINWWRWAVNSLKLSRTVESGLSFAVTATWHCMMQDDGAKLLFGNVGSHEGCLSARVGNIPDAGDGRCDSWRMNKCDFLGPLLEHVGCFGPEVKACLPLPRAAICGSDR